MVAQIFADTGQRMDGFDPVALEAFGLTYAGQFQQLGRIDRPAADDDLARGQRFARFAVRCIADAGAGLAF